MRNTGVTASGLLLDKDNSTGQKIDSRIDLRYKKSMTRELPLWGII